MTETNRTETAARVAHEANRAYCVTLGDLSQPAWDDAPGWQRASALTGAGLVLAGAITEPRQSHESWSEEKTRTGWVWGPVKDPETKQHPCLVPFEALPAEQQRKDVLFFNVVRSFA